MLLSYRHPFWKRFYARNWQPRVPTVIRQPFEVFPFSEEMVLRAMKTFQAGLQSGDERFRYMFSLGRSKEGPRRALRALFRHENESMEQLERNCGREFPNRSFGLMVNDLQSIEPGIWSGATAFLQDAHQWIDFPVARAILDLFYGNYSSSFLGLHKDTQEIFGFVVRGEKVLLAWPFEYFVSRVKGITAAARYFQVDVPVDYRKYRKDALVLRARPGDIIYWPSDYWHIAEGHPGSFSMMLSLGLFLPPYVSPKRTEELTRFRRKLLTGAGTYARNERSSMRSQEMIGMSPRAVGAPQLRWATGFSFQFGGPVTESLPGVSDETHAGLEIVKRNTSLLLWTVNRADRRVHVAANGYSVSLPHSPKISTLLGRVSRGEVISVGKASNKKHGPPGKDSRIAATYWNRQGELKTRRVRSHRDTAAWLIDWLLWARAVEARKKSRP